MARGVAGRRHEANPRRDLELCVDEHDEAGIGQRLDAIAEMRPLLERLLGHEERPVVRRHDVASVWKGAVPPDVIDVQMGVHDEVNLVGGRADPNKLVAVTDTLNATTLPAAESFSTIDAAGFGEVLRGVSLTPGS